MFLIILSDGTVMTSSEAERILPKEAFEFYQAKSMGSIKPFDAKSEPKKVGK
jgi:hypothetical protein